MRQLCMAFLVAALAGVAAGCGGKESDTTTATHAVKPAAESPAGPAPSVVTETSLDRALEKAKETGRNVLVVYASETCPYSRQMDSQTFADASVKAAMADFVVLRFEQGENSTEFENRWGRQPTPTVVTLDADGAPRGTMLNGVVAKADFLAYVAWAKTGEGAQPATKVGGG